MSNFTVSKTALAVALASSWTLGGPQALAQDEQIRLEEVIVTARKREESMQDVPISVSSITEELNRSSVQNLQDIQSYAPNVNIEKIGSNNGISVTIRGIGFQETDKSVEPPAGVILDGIYMGVIAGGILNNFDLERIEVLRGPQGTLFGKNTTAGALNVIRTAPTREWGVKAKVGAASWDRTEIQAVVNTPLTDNGGLKLYANNIEHDGFIEADIVGDDIGSVDYLQYGATVAFNLTDNFDLSFTAERVEDDSDTGAYANLNGFGALACLVSVGGFPPAGIPPEASGAPFGSGCEELDPDSGKDNSSVNEPNTAETTTDYFNLTMNWGLGDWVLTSVTGYVERDEAFRAEYDASQVEFLYIEASQDYEQFSQELRINGNLSDNINLTAGLYYWNSEYRQFQESFDMWYYLGIGFGPEGGFGPGDISSQLDGIGENTSYAAFASMDWQLTDRLLLNLGGRYTDEERTLSTGTTSFLFNGTVIVPGGEPVDFKDDWGEFSPRVALSYDINDQIMVYGSYASGFKSGGFFARTQNIDTINSYDPESVDTYEIGLKSEWFDNRLRVNAAVFFSDYTDKQEEVIVNLGDGNVTTIVNNASEVEIPGLEVEVVGQITSGLSAFFNYGYIDAEFVDFTVLADDGVTLVDQSDLKLRNAPEQTASVGVDYFLPIGSAEFSAHYNYFWRDEFHTMIDNNPVGLVDAGGFHNASIDLTFLERYKVSVYGRNIGDERYKRSVDIGISAWGSYNPPEHYGVEFTANF